MAERMKAQTPIRGNDRDAPTRDAELVAANVLRGGVLLSASLICIGVVMYDVRYALRGPDTHQFPHTLGTVIAGIAHGEPQSVIVLGLLVLLVTPVVRVAVSILEFALERDWRYVVITSIVLCVLLLSFLLSRGGA